MATGRPKSTPESFWRKVDRREPGECWPWKASVRNGYGHHCVNKVSVYAHRYAYAIHHGHEPSGRWLQVMHVCNNKLCCNPEHLVAGTASDNTTAAYRDGLAKAGHRHYRTKFSASVIEAVKHDPRSQTEIAAAYGLSQSHVSRIKRNDTRKHEAVNG